MQEAVQMSQWDTLVFAVPFLSFLVFGFFRLDQVFVAQKRPAAGSRRPLSGVDDDGVPILTDPDGRPWTKPRLRQSERAPAGALLKTLSRS